SPYSPRRSHPCHSDRREESAVLPLHCHAERAPPLRLWSGGAARGLFSFPYGRRPAAGSRPSFTKTTPLLSILLPPNPPSHALTASGKVMFSIFCTKLNTSPDAPHPKQ